MALLASVGACALGGSAVLEAQPSPNLDGFVEELTRRGQRFEDVGVAITEGYRKLGPDFPGMGEHWVNPGLVIAGTLDPDRPPVIAYTTRRGKRVLVGFAFTRVLAPDEVPPKTVFPASAWHDHTGGVDEESLILSGPASMHAHGEGYRLSMVHVWTALENPDDVLAQNNWALPFFRTGLPVPDEVSSSAARALSLTDVGIPFYRLLLSDGIELQDPLLSEAMRAFEERGEEVRTWVEARIGEDQIGRTDLRELESIWLDLWDTLERSLPKDEYSAIGMLKGG
ncbi:MAG: hypothetical protein OEN56_07025 [Gemmatimonadota bacterium]|nr:hypothetical protein [Gemmatimonadota bacterium]